MNFRRLLGIVTNKCPNCDQGAIFTSKNPFKNTMQMNSNCSNCNLKFEKEPGYFYGAMYITYMFNVALFVNFVLAYSYFLEPHISGWLLMIIYVLVTIVLTPFYIRLSRSVWLSIWG